MCARVKKFNVGGIQMKRLFSTVLVFVLLISSLPTALADDTFTLRDGIEFGDTLDDIKEKNTSLKPISQCKQFEYLEFVSHSDDYIDLTFAKYPDNGIWYRGTILGWSDMDCAFFFDEDTNGLTAMDYSFVFTDYTSEYAASCYVDIRDRLKEKYGTPLDIAEGKTHILSGPARERLNRVKYLASWEMFSADVVDSQEWLIENGSDYVKIDLVIYGYSGRYPTSNRSFLYIFIDLSYQIFTEAEYEAAKQANTAAARAKNDEL